MFKNKKFSFFLFLFLFFAGIIFLFFNEFGVIKYLHLKNEVDKLNERIDSVENRNKALESEIDSLEKKIPAKIEKTAREKYGMKREGEKVIEMIEK